MCRPHTHHSATRPCHRPWKGQGKDWVRGKDRCKHSRGLYVYRPPQLGSLQREPGPLTTDSTFSKNASATFQAPSLRIRFTWTGRTGIYLRIFFLICYKFWLCKGNTFLLRCIFNIFLLEILGKIKYFCYEIAISLILGAWMYYNFSKSTTNIYIFSSHMSKNCQKNKDILGNVLNC